MRLLANTRDGGPVSIGENLRSHAYCRLVKAQILELAIECRAADAELARNLRHLPTMMADGEFQHVGLQGGDRPDIAL